MVNEFENYLAAYLRTNRNMKVIVSSMPDGEGGEIVIYNSVEAVPAAKRSSAITQDNSIAAEARAYADLPLAA